MRHLPSAANLRPAAATPLMLFASALIVAGLHTGCAQWSYSRIGIGQEHGQYERAFPEAGVRRSETSLCYRARDAFGRTDAIVVLLTRDRRVCGKLHAMHLQRNYGFKVETGYRLVGELDPGLAELGDTGPIDALRAIADELTGTDGDQEARQTRAWVAAGLVRIVQRWPHGGDEGPAFTRLTDMLERVQGGGSASVTVDDRGVYVVEYAVGVTR